MEEIFFINRTFDVWKKFSERVQIIEDVCFCNSVSFNVSKQNTSENFSLKNEWSSRLGLPVQVGTVIVVRGQYGSICQDSSLHVFNDPTPTNILRPPF